LKKEKGLHQYAESVKAYLSWCLNIPSSFHHESAEMLGMLVVHMLIGQDAVEAAKPLNLFIYLLAD
jgi:hypothetical protein